jgi:hypothetical protein
MPMIGLSWMCVRMLAFVDGGFAQLQKHKKSTMEEWSPLYLIMDNSPALSRYSELSQSQHSYHVSPEPIILRQEQEDSSSDKDEQSDSFVERDTHDNHAVVAQATESK